MGSARQGTYLHRWISYVRINTNVQNIWDLGKVTYLQEVIKSGHKCKKMELSLYSMPGPIWGNLHSKKENETSRKRSKYKTEKSQKKKKEKKSLKQLERKKAKTWEERKRISWKVSWYI